MGKKITIYDIAEKLKLSASTVSRALADNPLISIKTRTRVKQAAQEMGYSDSNFTQPEADTIIILVPEIDNSFYSSVISSIRSRIGDRFMISIMCSENSSKIEHEIVSRLSPDRVRCLIISQSMDTYSCTHLKEAEKKGIPIILFNRIYHNGKCPKFLIDNYMDSYMLTRHLVSIGRRRIAFAAKHFNCPIYKERVHAYKDVLKENGIAFHHDNLIYSELTLEDTQEVISRFIRMKPRPDALILPNFISAIQAIAIAKLNNVAVPQDLAIVSFDEDPECRYSSPPLTGIERPTREIGEEIADTVLEIADGKLRDNEIIRIFRSDLIIRGSSFSC